MGGLAQPTTTLTSQHWYADCDKGASWCLASPWCHRGQLCTKIKSSTSSTQTRGQMEICIRLHSIELWHCSTYSVRTACHFARFTPDSDFFSPHILYSTYITHCLFTFTLVVYPLLTTIAHHIFSSVLAEPQNAYTGALEVWPIPNISYTLKRIWDNVWTDWF